MSPPLILINSVYSYKNRGDSAIVEATGRYIQSAYPNAEIGLLSTYWETNRYYYQSFGWHSLPLVWDIPLEKNKIKRLAMSAVSLGDLMLSSAQIIASHNPTISLYRRAAIILDVGGGTLFSSAKYKFQLGFYQHLLSLWLGTVFGKQVIVCPQSIGPFHNPLDAFAARWVLSRLTAIMARELITSKLLSGMGIKHVLMPDISFLGNFITPPSRMVSCLIDQIKVQGRDRKLIGITVLDWRWAIPESNLGTIAHYLEQLCETLGQLAATHPILVCIFPQVARGVENNDLDISIDFSAMLTQKLEGTGSDVFYADSIIHDLGPSDLSHLYGAMDLFIASRLHSAIFALLSGTPSLSLAYQPKTIGTFNLVGLKEWSFDIRSFKVNDLYHQCLYILEQGESAKWKVGEVIRNAHQKVSYGLDGTLRPLLDSSLGEMAT